MWDVKSNDFAHSGIQPLDDDEYEADELRPPKSGEHYSKSEVDAMDTDQLFAAAGPRRRSKPMDANAYARPLNEPRDKTRADPVSGFWLALVRSVATLASTRPAVTWCDPFTTWASMTHCHFVASRFSAASTSYACRVNPLPVIDAIVDAVAGTVFQPMHQPPPGAITHRRSHEEENENDHRGELQKGRRDPLRCRRYTREFSKRSRWAT